jgi:hypothetical protein
MQFQCERIRFGADDTPKALRFNVKRGCGCGVTYVILPGECAGIILVIAGAGEFGLRGGVACAGGSSTSD